MNNKGFAITTILYGTLILFLMLLVSMLGLLSTYKDRLSMLIDSNNGARDIINKKFKDSADEIVDSGEEILQMYVKTNTGNLNCRKSPNTNAVVVTSFSKCSELSVYPTTTNWFYNSENDCYLYGDYLTSDKNICS
ncbi:MAG: hypothetical protein IJE89_05560 [Bacilli bacterium]|nr:hypothetical protein [Bacilli bacterium]